MLTTNLSTRPFYNERAVRGLLLGMLLLVLVLTAFNAVRAVSLRNEERSLSARATQATAEAARLRTEAQQMTGQIDPKELAAVSAAATEANDVIAQRTFSWVALLADLEATVPDNVRVTSIDPRVEEGIMRVTFYVEADSPEQLALFMNGLERRGSFSDVLPRTQHQAEDLLEATVEGTYEPRVIEPTATVAPAAQKEGRP